MRTTARLVGYEVRDVVRSRWLGGYGLFFLVVTSALLRFSASGAAAALSLANVVLFIVPLVSLVFGTMYLYNAREFTELMLAQPVARRQMFGGLYLGLALPLGGAFVAGTGLPLLVHGADDSVPASALVALVLTGLALTLVFLALATLIAVHADDRVRGLGIAIGLWLAVAVLYDGLVLVAATALADYPLEQPLLALTLANPVDLARVALLLRFDVGALLGYTGAVFSRFFGSTAGTLLAAAALAAWLAVPLAAAARRFGRRDF